MNLEDKLYGFLKIYKPLPYFLKYFIGYMYRLLPNRIKFGEFYFEYLNRIIHLDKSTAHNLLKEQLTFVKNNITHYKGSDYNGICDFPIIDKNLIIKNRQNFVSSSNQNKIKANTGGSSGTPFEFYLEKGVSRPKEKAHFDWYWKQFGYKKNSKILVVRGEALANNKLYEFQSIENKLAISCYLINKDNIFDVIDVINKFQPKFIHAYPSSLKNLINNIEQSNKILNINIKAVFLGSEGMFQGDKEKIGNYFNAKISHWYGHSERLIHAGNCLYSDEFHIFNFYGYAELVDYNGKIINSPNVKGKIIATGFDNRVMPLVRYDTGDEAEYSEKIKCKCGFKGKSFKIIHGRQQDYIYLNDGTKVSLTAFIFGQHFEEFNNINELQIIQKIKGVILIKIVLNRSISNQEFINKLKNSVEGKLIVTLQIVLEITKTKRGKHMFLIQKVNK